VCLRISKSPASSVVVLLDLDEAILVVDLDLMLQI
jgi:hypothetical protein